MVDQTACEIGTTTASLVRSSVQTSPAGRAGRARRAVTSENGDAGAVGSVALSTLPATVDAVDSVKAKTQKKAAEVGGPRTLPFRVVTHHGEFLKDFATSSEAGRWAKSHVKDGKWSLEIAYGPSRNVSR